MAPAIAPASRRRRAEARGGAQAITLSGRMPYDLLVRGGRAVLETGVAPVDVAVRDGRVAALLTPGQPAAAAEVIDASGLLVLPGLVDAHTHLCEPGYTDWEDFYTGTRAAAAGGVTTVVEMPLSNPITLDLPSLERKRATADARAVVDFALWGALVPGAAAHIPAMHAAGVVAFKAFLADVPTYRMVDDAEFLAGLDAAAGVGALVGVHCENDALLHSRRAGLAAAGRRDPLAHAEAHSELVEVEAVARALTLAEAAGARFHAVHLSCARSVRLVADARRRGLPVSCETCPHYLLLDHGDLARLGPYARCAPALRCRETVEDLWQLVRSGEIDLIATDHSPYTFKLKDAGREDIWRAALGVTGLQTMLPLLYDAGCRRRGLGLPDLVRLTAGAPARRFGLFPQKGSLWPGADADLVLFDPDASWVVRREDLLYKNPWSPFEGWTVRGRVMATLVRGRAVWRDGEICAPPGSGRFVRRRDR